MGNGVGGGCIVTPCHSLLPKKYISVYPHLGTHLAITSALQVLFSSSLSHSDFNFKVFYKGCDQK